MPNFILFYTNFNFGTTNSFTSFGKGEFAKHANDQLQHMKLHAYSEEVVIKLPSNQQ